MSEHSDRATTDRYTDDRIAAEVRARCAADEVLSRMDRDGCFVPKGIIWGIILSIITMAASGGIYIGVTASDHTSLSEAIREINGIDGRLNRIEAQTDFLVKDSKSRGAQR